MKRKHYGILSVGMIVLSVLAAVLYGQSEYWRTESVRTVLKTKPQILSQSPDFKTLREANELMRVLPSLAMLGDTDPTKVKMSLFGYEPYLPTRKSDEESSEKDTHSLEHKLSFIFFSKTAKFCVIDGNIFKEGSKISDGIQVASINRFKVLVKSKSNSQWLYLSEESQDNKKDQI